MASPYEIRVPLLNANEDEYTLVALYVTDGASVQAGQVIATVESTKATVEVETEQGGFVRALAFAEDDRVKAGQRLAWVTQSADSPLPEQASKRTEGDVIATAKARALAEAHGIDLASLGVEGIIREKHVQAAIPADAQRPSSPAIVEARQSSNQVLVYGGGGHAAVLIDLLRQSRPDLHIVGAIDDKASGNVSGVPIVGGTNLFAELRESGVRKAVLGIGAVTHNQSRIGLFDELLKAGFEVINLIHPKATVEPSATMGRGNQIMAGAVVSSRTRIGDNTIINCGSVISHDCTIGSHAHITPGAVLAGGVTIGEGSVIGMAATVYLGVTIGKNVTIANGVHILSDVPDGKVVRSSQ